MESTLNPSGALEVFGPLGKPARKTRRRQSTGTVSPQGILSQDQAMGSDASAVMQGISGAYARGATVEELSDAELVELVLTGTQEAFEVLVERYKDAVQNLAYRMLSNVTEAEDVTFLEWITDLGAGPEQSALQGEQHDEIQAYLQKLPSKYRAVILLRYWYDLSYEEIAMALNLTPALVKARLHRARELLARYIQENKENEEEQSDALPRR